ncbi:MAG: SUMF1/EgtB/PvdO family nonheme iron enzyme [Planctomycetota bacterium]
MMPVPKLPLMMTLVLATLSIASAADNDKVAERVQQAREAYQAEAVLVREEVAKELDSKETAERKRANPDLERIKTIKSDREELSAAEKIPDSISAKIKTRINKNRTKFINELTAARNEYVRSKQDSEAEAIALELEKFKAEVTPDKAKPAEDKTPPAGAKAWPKNAPPLAVSPFDAAKARKHQQAWARYLKIPVDRTNSVGMKFVLIPPGEFMMGSTSDEIAEALRAQPDNMHIRGLITSEKPQHKVVLTQPFYMSIHEVTCKEYERVMGTNPGPGGDVPVQKVNWNDAAEFCSKLSEKEKLKPFYSLQDESVTRLEGQGYRMPTEAEWEFACRAGTMTKYSNGDGNDKLSQVAWITDRVDRGLPAGSLKPNAFMLFDMHGNASEWVDDTYDPKFYEQFENTVAINPKNHSTSVPDRVVRGGDWALPALSCRSSTRNFIQFHHRYERVGFRVALAAVAAP